MTRPIRPADERCPVCDRAECGWIKDDKTDRAKFDSDNEFHDHVDRVLAVREDCIGSAVDWRARALAAEKRLAEVERERAVTFEEVWARTGYRYGGDALENVRMGWALARGEFDDFDPDAAVADVHELRADRDALKLAAEALQAEVERMRPVVEAAMKCREAVLLRDDVTDEMADVLDAAVDAYRDATKEVGDGER